MCSIYLEPHIFLVALLIDRNADICVWLCILEIRTVKELPPGKVSHVQSSPLWKPILRHGLSETRETNQTKTPSDQVCSDVLNPVMDFFPFLSVLLSLVVI